MNIKKCNSCGKILTKDDDYFTMDEITFNKGNNPKQTSRLYLSSPTKDETYDMNESWSVYTDFDFCPECFKKEGLEKLL